MAEFDVLRQEILTLFGRVTPLAEQRRAEETVDRLVGARERLSTGRLTVVVCGEFKRGKSSLLNALLEQPNLLSVDAFFATRLVTTIGRGDQEQVHVTLDNGRGKLPERRRIRRDQIGEYAAQGTTHPDAERALLLEIELPDERLASGLLLVDTPGVGGVFHDHTRATKQYLPSADAILFVASAEEPLTQSELNFLAEATHAVRAADNPDSLVFALTKVDLVTDVDRYLTGVRARIAEVTGREDDQIVVLPVSSTAKTSGLAMGNATLVEQSGFPALEEALWTQLARHRAKVLLGGALAEIESANRILLDPLVAEETALRDTSRTQIAGLEQQAKRESERLADLARSAAPWRELVADELQALEKQLTERAEREFDRVWTRADTIYLDDRDHLIKPDRLGERINGDLGMALSSVSEWGAKQASTLQRDIAKRIGLELGGAALGQLPPPGLIDLGGFGRLKRPTRVVERREEAEYKTVYEERVKERGSFVRGVSTALSGWGGLKRAWDRSVDYFSPPKTEIVEKRVKTKDARTWTEEVKEEIPPHLLTQRREELRAAIREGRRTQGGRLAATLIEIVADFARDITADLDSRITREQERTNDTLTRLRSAAASTAAQAETRLERLAGEQRPLREIEAECGRLVDRVSRLSGSVAA